MSGQKSRLDYNDPKVLEKMCNALNKLNSWDIKRDVRGITMKESRIVSLILDGEYTAEYLRNALRRVVIRKAIVSYMKRSAEKGNSSPSISIYDLPESPSPKSKNSDLGSQTTENETYMNMLTAEAQLRRIKTENEDLKRKYHQIEKGLHDALTKSKRMELQIASFKKRETESHQRLKSFVEAELQAVNRSKLEDRLKNDLKRIIPSSSSSAD